MKAYTGVSSSFTARHTDPYMGEGEHGHTWHVTVWFKAEPFRDGRVLKTMLNEVLGAWEGTLMPPSLWAGEDIAKAIMGVLGECVGVDVSRPEEGFYARVRA